MNATITSESIDFTINQASYGFKISGASGTSLVHCNAPVETSGDQGESSLKAHARQQIKAALQAALDAL